VRMQSAFAALALVLLPQPAWAAEKTEDTYAAATALVEKLQFERVLDNAFVGLKDMFAANAIAGMLRDDKDGSMAQMFTVIPGGRDRFAEILGDEFLHSLRRQYPGFKADAAQQYTQIFSLDELDELNIFFSTGVGEKWLANSPKVERAMKLWGQKAGMKAGLEALTATIQRIESGQNDKEVSQ